jgi:hypothetical protein
MQCERSILMNPCCRARLLARKNNILILAFASRRHMGRYDITLPRQSRPMRALQIHFSPEASFKS